MNFEYLLNNLKHTSVLVIGDLMLDHYIWGDIHRISPEAPVPVVNVNNDTFTAGGAANVALNLTNLGVKTSVIGHCSADEPGKKLTQILAENKVNFLPSNRLIDAPTIIKTRVIVRGQQLCRIDRESSREFYSIDTDADFETSLRSALKKVDAVIISDYAKGVITQSLLDCILKIAVEMPGILVAVDPKPARRLSFRDVGLLTPNKAEALQLAGIPDLAPGEEYPLERVCRNIYNIYNPYLLVVTLGADGMAISQEGRVIEVLPTVARQVFDVSGAGDTVIATLAAVLASGATPAQAARLANAAAGCVVGHVGTAPILLHELKEWLEMVELQHGNSYVTI